MMRRKFCGVILEPHGPHEWISPGGIRFDCPGVVEENGYHRVRTPEDTWPADLRVGEGGDPS